MATHASRDTTTGLKFEKMTDFFRPDGLKLKGNAINEFIKERKGTVPTWSFRPDDAYYFEDTNELIIYEKKEQNTSGSADEKLAACEWRLNCYKDMAVSAGIPAENVNMIYILSDWFKNDRYNSILNYMESKGCYFFFWNDNNDKKKKLMNFRCKENV